MRQAVRRCGQPNFDTVPHLMQGQIQSQYRLAHKTFTQQ